MEDSAIATMSPETLRGFLLRQPLLSSMQIQPIASFQKKEIIYVLPEDAKDSQRMAFFAQLMIRGRASTVDTAEWRAWVLTIVTTGFYGISMSAINHQPILYEKHILSAQQLGTLQETYDCILGWKLIDTTDADENTMAKDAVRATMLELDGLPEYKEADIRREIGDCLSIEAIYGYLAIVLVLAAKAINEQNRVAITINRPRNIEQKYRIPGCPCLTGDLRISDEGHGMINAAFVSMDHFRGILFTRLAELKNHTGDRGTSVVMTLVRLLDWTGMSYVPIIDRFLSAKDNITDYAFLLPSYQNFVSSLRALAKIPGHLRPFYKLIHGDTTRLFNRREIEELMVCAIKEEAKGRPSLTQYGLPANSERIWQTYLRTKKALQAAQEEEENE